MPGRPRSFFRAHSRIALFCSRSLADPRAQAVRPPDTTAPQPTSSAWHPAHSPRSSISTALRRSATIRCT